MKYEGSCHCGAIRFSVEFDLEHTMRCNCSICGRTGTLMAFVPVAAFTLHEGAEHYTDYQFDKRRIHHGFCDVCGVRPFARPTDDDADQMMINVGCLKGVDVRDHAEAPVYDGASI